MTTVKILKKRSQKNVNIFSVYILVPARFMDFSSSVDNISKQTNGIAVCLILVHRIIVPPRQKHQNLLDSSSFSFSPHCRHLPPSPASPPPLHHFFNSSSFSKSFSPSSSSFSRPVVQTALFPSAE